METCLELKCPVLAILAHHLPQIDCTSIPQLTCPLHTKGGLDTWTRCCLIACSFLASWYGHIATRDAAFWTGMLLNGAGTHVAELVAAVAHGISFPAKRRA